MTMNTQKNTASSAGFSILETVVAMVIILIALLGALQAINYSIIYNAGNATRAQNLAILQQEVERLRAAKFTPAGVDSAAPPGTGPCRTDAQRDITGGVKPNCTVTTSSGGRFLVSTAVDDNPFNGPNTYDVDATARIKEITVQVKLDSPSPGWQMAVPAKVVLRRTIGN
jgi:type II secretory pathway pseudopilin PulG